MNSNPPVIELALQKVYPNTGDSVVAGGEALAGCRHRLLGPDARQAHHQSRGQEPRRN